MPHRHKQFWIDLSGKIGPPVFAATLVACLLSNRIEVTHLLLLAASLGLIAADHYYNYHKQNQRTKEGEKREGK